MLNDPIITLLTFLALICVSFGIQSCWRVLSELIFITSAIRLGRIHYFFSVTFFIISLFNFIWLSVYPSFVHTIYTEIHNLIENLFQRSNTFLDNRDIPSLARWTPSLHKRFLSIFPLHMKAKPYVLHNLLQGKVTCFITLYLNSNLTLFLLVRIDEIAIWPIWWCDELILWCRWILYV